MDDLYALAKKIICRDFAMILVSLHRYNISSYYR